MTEHIPWQSTTDDFDDMWEDEAGGVPDILSTMFFARESTAPPGLIPCDPTHFGDVGRSDVKALTRELITYLSNTLFSMAYADDKSDVLERLPALWKHMIDLHRVLGIDAEDVFRQFFLSAIIEKAKM